MGIRRWRRGWRGRRRRHDDDDGLDDGHDDSDTVGGVGCDKRLNSKRGFIYCLLLLLACQHLRGCCCDDNDCGARIADGNDAGLKDDGYDNTGVSGDNDDDDDD